MPPGLDTLSLPIPPPQLLGSVMLQIADLPEAP